MLQDGGVKRLQSGNKPWMRLQWLSEVVQERKAGNQIPRHTRFEVLHKSHGGLGAIRGFYNADEGS
jgi:hypothetical protein